MTISQVMDIIGEYDKMPTDTFNDGPAALFRRISDLNDWPPKSQKCRSQERTQHEDKQRSEQAAVDAAKTERSARDVKKRAYYREEWHSLPAEEQEPIRAAVDKEFGHMGKSFIEKRCALEYMKRVCPNSQSAQQSEIPEADPEPKQTSARTSFVKETPSGIIIGRLEKQ